MRRKRWRGLHYVDLFAGAGMERLEKSRRLDWGSPLIAAQTSYAFDCLHLCEKNRRKCDALQTRIEGLRQVPAHQILHGDANELVHDAVAAIPDKCLSLAFLDPYGLHLDFETLQALAAKRADLIVFFPDRLDILRNWEAYYWDNPNSNLDRVLGPDANWRAVRDSTPPHRWVEAFLTLYCRQIGSLGYTEFAYEGIPSTGQRLYWLIFCSKHPAGAKIWGGISQKKPDNQQTFDFKPR
jgi:three-Cys-motif partner protein